MRGFDVPEVNFWRRAIALKREKGSSQRLNTRDNFVRRSLRQQNCYVYWGHGRRALESSSRQHCGT